MSSSGPLVCRFCPRTFKKIDHLQRHIRSHTKERPFRCDDCGKSYSRHDTLLRHRKAHRATANTHDASSLDDRISNAAPYHINETSAADLISFQVVGESVTEPGVISVPTPVDGAAGSCAFESRPIHTNLDRTLLLNNSFDDGEVQAVGEDQCSSHSSQEQLNVDLDIPSLGMDSWAINHEPFGAWQVGEGFDLEAFNTTLLSPSSADQMTWEGPMASENQAVSMIPGERSYSLTQSTMNRIQTIWITKVVDSFWANDTNASYSAVPSQQVTPASDGTSPPTVDDSYRHSLSERLCPRWKELALPSTELLNSALRLFFLKFNPIFPILHEPTFQASNHKSLLLLSMCSVGCLFMGSSAATIHGPRMFERLNKAILASWENYLNKPTQEIVSLIQASMIGQVFAYLSGNPRYLATVEAFHGTVIAFARRCGLLSAHCHLPQIKDQGPQELEAMWKEWAKSEESSRTALGLYILDGQIASTFHHEPTLRHNTIRSSSAATDDLFAAPTAIHWASLVRNIASPPAKLADHLHFTQPQHDCRRPVYAELACKNSRFSCYVILHGIGAAVQENNAAGQLSSTDRVKFTDALICWYYSYEKSRPLNESDPFSLMVLFHEIFMQLLVKFDELEKAIGRDGLSEAVNSQRYVRSWLSTIEAKRCIIHASLIHRQIGSMRVDAEPAMHLPRSVFLAALAWYCYVQFHEEEQELSYSSQTPADIPEIALFDVNSFDPPFETSVLKNTRSSLLEASSLRGLIDMLARIGRWEMSNRLARILKLLVDEDEGGFLF